MSSVQVQRTPEEFRLHVAVTALQLFQAQGFESTTVDHIAGAAGVSRRTLFRQFGSKDDMVFADHESLLAELDHFLSAADSSDPWQAVCDAAELVLASLARTPELAIQRYQIQRSVPALRDREIITSYRYERLFIDYLRRSAPTADDITIVSFAAAVTATHNYLLRQALRRGVVPTTDELPSALIKVRNMFRPQGEAADERTASSEHGVVVATFPPGATRQQILSEIGSQLDRRSDHSPGTK